VNPKIGPCREKGKLNAKVPNSTKVQSIDFHNTKPQKTYSKQSPSASGAGNGINSGAFLLDTLGQPGHNQSQCGFQGMAATPVKGQEYLKKKAKGAYFAKSLARHLSQLESPLHKAYKRTLFDCCNVLMQEGTKLTAKYCDSRWCNTCNRIRTARMINGYLDPLTSMSEPYFVTLTIPNVSAAELRHTIVGMTTTFSNITKSFRRNADAIKGIRKLECTYNSHQDNYHPHFHCIVDGSMKAKALVNEWLNRYPMADMKAQDIRPANPDTIRELFKYVTKIVGKSSDGYAIFVPALDTIFQATYRMRTFQSFGGIRMVKEDIEELQADEYDIEFYESVAWLWHGNDWQNMQTGKLLTNYVPSQKMIELVTTRMIT
jgi:hypothetical protein